jgi:hypothetical protein
MKINTVGSRYQDNETLNLVYRQPDKFYLENIFATFEFLKSMVIFDGSTFEFTEPIA